mmetsp:Transcript_11983/g.26143  ORF Transcript_11983/g.26143 Transcript_11983/m.26143 type:complete len:219 (+) Transcript_11983:556-1212(+)
MINGEQIIPSAENERKELGMSSSSSSPSLSLLPRLSSSSSLSVFANHRLLVAPAGVFTSSPSLLPLLPTSSASTADSFLNHFLFVLGVAVALTVPGGRGDGAADAAVRTPFGVSTGGAVLGGLVCLIAADVVGTTGAEPACNSVTPIEAISGKISSLTPASLDFFAYHMGEFPLTSTAANNLSTPARSSSTLPSVDVTAPAHSSSTLAASTDPALIAT